LLPPGDFWFLVLFLFLFSSASFLFLSFSALAETYYQIYEGFVVVVVIHVLAGAASPVLIDCQHRGGFGGDFVLAE
jgi:hypothetical protein